MTRVVVISNRLPVTIHPEREPGDGDVEQSSGGLVSALRSVVEDFDEVVWIGWPGSFVAEDDQERVERRLREESSSIRLVPVFLSKEDVEDFYNGFANASLWPLLHWMTPYTRFKKVWAESYRRVNQQFADVVLRLSRPGDLLWVHDYHLFLLPLLLRKGNGEVNEGSAANSPRHQPPTPIMRPKDLPPPLDTCEEEEQPQDGDRSADDLASRPSHLPDRLYPFQFLSADGGGGEAGESGQSPKNVRFGEEVQDFDSVTSSKVSPIKIEPPYKLRIAFFLHTPFPSFEIISTLPNCAEIVEGVLGADLVGFHTYNYLRHYRSCVVRMCGVTPEIDSISHLGMRTKLGVFPIGANCQSISEAMQSERFSEHLRTYTNQFQGKSLVLSVERLDYSKGMPQKLAAIERYLYQAKEAKKRQEKGADQQHNEEDEHVKIVKERAERLKELQDRFQERRGGKSAKGGSKLRTSFRKWVGDFINYAGSAGDEPLDHTRTIFLFIAVPSRQDVEEYRNIEEEVHRSISEINGRYSTIDHQPIVYIHRGVSVDELAALYARADCCLVTPLVDGMNLVAKEYVAAKDKTVGNVVPGTIVLSEAAGAAQELFDALVVNPYDEDAVADAIHVGLELTKGEVLEEESRWEVTDRMRKAILQNDAQTWARKMLRELQCSAGEQTLGSGMGKLADHLPMFTARFFFENSQGTKALFLDFDGRMLKQDDASEKSVGDNDKICPFSSVFTEEDDRIFAALSARRDLAVHIVSGASKECVDGLFGQYESITLLAENGLYLKRPGQKWKPFCPQSSVEWMEKVKPVIELFCRCTPGSKSEEKATSIIWDYSGCDDEYGLFKAKELMHLLALSLGNLPCQTMESHDSCLVEVKSLQVKKGLATRMLCILQEEVREPFTEIMCIGDDDADESMFVDAKKAAYTVKVGLGPTMATHRLRDANEVRQFLGAIVAQKHAGTGTMLNGDSMALFKSIDERPGSSSPIDEAEHSEGDPLDFLANQEQESADAC
mmetsp:Transcript_18787/g.37869  ORF Transcript_18787/g.37869 Transcript_18787/m.37869 type:complete len:1007 (+) Transcript_18787:168-3188(+)|eukprot:CAMPEP_0170228822 /NCGR_PEP_ID=MMETSP0116_2-20130129/14132_1 /TAXON_ID=400756 /ORGANISM="Durinskia baltica, Strain CSIRO CS-38" /LENGTH=1006 /DNA_ID=CAMNT_0010479567 /DNA_START=168 /DNA_END=3188 /DNA_ORIENTATION=+